MTLKIVQTLDRIVTRINKITGIIASIIVFLLMVLTILDVAGRSALRPIQGSYELTYLFLAIVVYIGMGYTQSVKGHITIDFLTSRLSKRIRTWLEVVTNFASFGIISLMAWRTYEYSTMITKNVSGELGMPLHIFVKVCAIGILLLAVTLLLDFIKSMCKAVGKHV